MGPQRPLSIKYPHCYYIIGCAYLPMPLKALLPHLHGYIEGKVKYTQVPQRVLGFMSKDDADILELRI